MRRAVLSLAAQGFKRPEVADFTLDRHAHQMGHLDHLGRHGNVFVIRGGRLAIGFERAIHHDRGKPVGDRRKACRGRVAMVLMHADGDMRVKLDRGADQV